MTDRRSDHPDELLAEFVEGTLGTVERARVEEHLAACQRCREEVDLAEEARRALATLPELEVPPGTALALRRRARAGGPSAAVWRVVAPIAAAAVLVAGGIVVLTRLVDGQEEAAEPGAPEAAMAPAPGAAEEGVEAAGDRALSFAKVPRYSESDTDYTRDDLPAVGRRLRDEASLAAKGGLASTATSFYRDFEVSALPQRLRDIYRCVVAEVPPEQLLVPFTIEAASFEGEPAYLASFLQGPAPDQPYDRVVIWVVGREDCSLRSLASQRL